MGNNFLSVVKTHVIPQRQSQIGNERSSMSKKKGEAVRFRPRLATEGRLKFATAKLGIGPSEYFTGLDEMYGREFLERVKRQRAHEAKRHAEETEQLLAAPVP